MLPTQKKPERETPPARVPARARLHRRLRRRPAVPRVARRGHAGHGRRLTICLLGAFTAGCGDPAAPVDDEPAIPPPGPHFTVLPIDFDLIAHITPLGHNNKVLPVGHTYWSTCDFGLVPDGRPCQLGNHPVRSPVDGVVWYLAPGDGEVTIEGPPGLITTLAHVTPVAGLRRGDTVQAGDTVATMFQPHSMDFGVMNPRVRNDFVRAERYSDAYIHAQSPLEQYPEPLRSQAISRMYTDEDPLGRLEYDVAGTASGGWFKETAPLDDRVLTVDYAGSGLFLGRLVERKATRIMTIGDPWPEMLDRILVAEEGAPAWEDITPADGTVSIRMWELGRDHRPSFGRVFGTVLVEVLEGGRLRLDWQNTHEPVAGFSSEARVYVR